MSTQQKQIFVHDQLFWQLDVVGDKSLRWLEPVKFRLAGLPDDELRLAGSNQNPWRQTTRDDILDHLTAGSVKRLCVTTNAGIGKSTFLLWLQCQLSKPESRFVPIRLEPRDSGLGRGSACLTYSQMRATIATSTRQRE